MKHELLQVYWHGDKQRIMTADFFPNSNLLITGGPDEEDEEHEERVFIKVIS